MLVDVLSFSYKYTYMHLQKCTRNKINLLWQWRYVVSFCVHCWDWCLCIQLHDTFKEAFHHIMLHKRKHKGYATVIKKQIYTSILFILTLKILLFWTPKTVFLGFFPDRKLKRHLGWTHFFLVLLSPWVLDTSSDDGDEESLSSRDLWEVTTDFSL